MSNRTVEVLVRNELPTPAGQFDNTSTTGVARQRLEGDAVAVGIAVVAEQLRRGEFERRVLVGGKHIDSCDRRAVGGGDVDLHLAGA
jgi:hypothetical protein